jgi:hypothetical protein
MAIYTFHPVVRNTSSLKIDDEGITRYEIATAKINLGIIQSERLIFGNVCGRLLRRNLEVLTILSEYMGSLWL